MSREEMITAVMECAEKLGRVPTYDEVVKMTTINPRLIRKHFVTFTQLLGECQMESRGNGKKLDAEALFRDWATVARKVKKVPSVGEYAHLGSYSETPFRVRFGTWPKIPQAFKRYAEGKGATEEWKDVLEIIEKQEAEEAAQAMKYMRARNAGAAKGASGEPPVLIDRPVYGPPLRGPYPLAHCPTNEAGVMYLFGSMADDLGFLVLRIQAAFPDCEAMRRVEGDKWQWVRIEFEHESRNFLNHAHDVNGCDLIVCWENNWPECPLEVVELKKAVSNQPSAAGKNQNPTTDDTDQRGLPKSPKLKTKIFETRRNGGSGNGGSGGEE